jgi:hypothetical protein
MVYYSKINDEYYNKIHQQCIKSSDLLYNLVSSQGYKTEKQNKSNSFTITINNRNIDKIYIIVPISCNKSRKAEDIINKPIIDIALLKNNRFFYDYTIGYGDAKRVNTYQELLDEIKRIISL